MPEGWHDLIRKKSPYFYITYITFTVQYYNVAHIKVEFVKNPVQQIYYYMMCTYKLGLTSVFNKVKLNFTITLNVAEIIWNFIKVVFLQIFR